MVFVDLLLSLDFARSFRDLCALSHDETWKSLQEEYQAFDMVVLALTPFRVLVREILKFLVPCRRTRSLGRVVVGHALEIEDLVQRLVPFNLESGGHVEGFRRGVWTGAIIELKFGTDTNPNLDAVAFLKGRPDEKSSVRSVFVLWIMGVDPGVKLNEPEEGIPRFLGARKLEPTLLPDISDGIEMITIEFLHVSDISSASRDVPLHFQIS